MHTNYEIPAIDYCDSSNIYATGGGDNKINVRNVNNDQLLINLEGHTNFICSVIFSEQSDYLISGSSDKSIKLWSTVDWKCKFTLTEH